VLSLLISTLLYLGALRDGSLPSTTGNSGEVWYDFFLGRELNPRIGNFDLKFFFELRTGLFLWVLLDMSFCLAAYDRTGSIPLPLLFVTVVQVLYVIDSVWLEPAVLTTLDITTEGFGYMLCFGNTAWVPFIYSLQARFLSHTAPTLPFSEASFPATCYFAVLAALWAIGYFTFRLSNLEKNNFRNDPKSVPHLVAMETASGSKLLISGWWGTAR
jgi:Delta14-sterol reductase